MGNIWASLRHFPSSFLLPDATGPRGLTKSLKIAFAIVLIAYVIGISAFSRSFARAGVQVDGIPLFTGEAAIASVGLLLVLVTMSDHKFPFKANLPLVGLALYLAIGGAFAVMGILHGYGVAALRDFALVYYLVFYLFTLAYLAFGGRPALIVHAVSFGGVVASIGAVGSFLLAPSLSLEHAAPSWQALVAWLAVLELATTIGPARGWVRKTLLVGGIALCMTTVYLAAYRTMLAVMVTTTAIMWIGALKPGTARARPLPDGAMTLSIVVAAFCVAVVGHAFLVSRTQAQANTNSQPTSIPQVLAVLSQRWVRGFARLPTTIAAQAGVEATAGQAGPETTAGQAGPEATAGQAGPETTAGQADGSFDAVEGSLSFRVEVWRKALARIESSPLNGIGFGPNAALFPDAGCEIASSSTSNCGNAHNTFLTLAMRMGIPAFLLFLATSAYIVMRALGRAWRAPFTSLDDMTPWLLLAAFSSLAIYAMMSLFFESPYLSPLYWIFLALMYYWSSTSSHVPYVEAAS